MILVFGTLGVEEKYIESGDRAQVKVQISFQHRWKDFLLEAHMLHSQICGVSYLLRVCVHYETIQQPNL